MATDLETRTDPGEPTMARPSLKIVGLHIRGLKSIGSLDLPEDGLGWDGPMPDMLMVGGINGSGKTTLLEFLAAAFDQLEDPPSGGHRPFQISPALKAAEALLDFQYKLAGSEAGSARILVGDVEFVNNNGSENCAALQYLEGTSSEWARRRNFLASNPLVVIDWMEHVSSINKSLPQPPRVVYFPSERRTLISPPTAYKSAGTLSDRPGFVDRWEPPETWDDSLEARLYAVRWADLNAKEAGQPEAATQFRSYQIAFDRFFEGRKQVKWTHRGELVVETKGGAIHDFSELSSGEKQVILFMGELLHRWRPGSLILIDEPELHLHESYQTRLWHSLLDWQKERGGQVIVTTQSDHLFGISDPGIKVLLSVGRDR